MEIVKEEEPHVNLRDKVEQALKDLAHSRQQRKLTQIEQEENDGIISYEFVTNDGSDDSLCQLLECKCLFGRQLPKMPKEYIVRLVFDRRHMTLVMKRKEPVPSVIPSPAPSEVESVRSQPKGNKPPTPEKSPTINKPAGEKHTVVAAVCFRPFRNFAEIAFLAVNSKEQVRGYGTRLMNHLKEGLKVRGITDLVTYADNAAVGYFSKQGFYSPTSAQADRVDSEWHTCVKTGYDGYIKDYDGANKMVCCIYKDIDYLTLQTMREDVTSALWKAFIDSNNFVRYKGLSKIPEKLYDIPGLEFLEPKRDDSPPPPTTTSSRASRRRAEEGLAKSESGESPPRQRPVPSRLQVPTSIEAMVSDVVETALSHGSSWPFKEPVDVELAPDYYQVVRNPMDLATMKAKNAKGQYKSLNQVRDDFKLMFENCVFYNGDDSIYTQAANVLEKAITQRIERLEQIRDATSRR
jgi:histone acetyltransferase